MSCFLTCPGLCFPWFLLIFGENRVLCKNWLVSYACADCMFSVDVLSLIWTLAIVSVKGGASAGLLDQKKGKFAWFSHSTETHGNVSYALCVLMCIGPYRLHGRVLLLMSGVSVCGGGVHKHTCTLLLVYVCMCVFMRGGPLTILSSTG